MRAARYRRVSGENNSSLEEQLNAMNAYCIAHGYSMSDEHLYTDIMTGMETA